MHAVPLSLVKLTTVRSATTLSVESLRAVSLTCNQLLWSAMTTWVWVGSRLRHGVASVQRTSVMSQCYIARLAELTPISSVCQQM